MRIGWRAITALQRFLCERQNALVNKKASRKDISFEIKKGRFGDLLREINEDICRDNPISPDELESILDIFVKDGLIKPIEDSKDKFMVSEETYRLSGIEMANPAPARRSWVKPKRLPAKEKLEIKLQEKPSKKVKEELEKVPARIEKKPEEKVVEEEEKIEEKPPQPIIWAKTEQEKIARSKAIAQFEKGILLYYKRRYQEAIIEFQKVVDNFNMVMDVAHKAKHYIEFCKHDLEKNKMKERRI